MPWPAAAESARGLRGHSPGLRLSRVSRVMDPHPCCWSSGGWAFEAIERNETWTVQTPNPATQEPSS